MTEAASPRYAPAGSPKSGAVAELTSLSFKARPTGRAAPRAHGLRADTSGAPSSAASAGRQQQWTEQTTVGRIGYRRDCPPQPGSSTDGQPRQGRLTASLRDGASATLDPADRPSNAAATAGRQGSERKIERGDPACH